MNLLKKRAVAIVIAVLVVLMSTVLSGSSGLKGAIRDVEMLYYEGVEAEEGHYLRPSIDSQMRIRHNTVNSMLGILSGYAELDAAVQQLKTAKDHVYNNLGNYDRDTIEGMGWANQELETAITALQLAMEQVSFPEREKEMLETCLNDLAGAQRMIEQSGYNEAVREFNTTDMQRFPANMLLGLQGKYPDGAAYFG